MLGQLAFELPVAIQEDMKNMSTCMYCFLNYNCNWIAGYTYMNKLNIIICQVANVLYYSKAQLDTGNGIQVDLI